EIFHPEKQMTKREFEGLIQSGAMAVVSISDHRRQGEGFVLYGYGYWNDVARSVIKEMGNCVTSDNGRYLSWLELEPLLDYIISTGWQHRIEIDF
ncbi:MAG: hypothetical protein ACXV7J_15205, partial [Methylomonas sp.]